MAHSGFSPLRDFVYPAATAWIGCSWRTGGSAPAAG